MKKLLTTLRQPYIFIPTFCNQLPLSAKLFLIPEKIIRMGEPPIRIEIVTSISGATFKDCYASRVIDELDGVTVSLIGLADLKGNKKASGRYKDLDDLENLPVGRRDGAAWIHERAASGR